MIVVNERAQSFYKMVLQFNDWIGLSKKKIYIRCDNELQIKMHDKNRNARDRDRKSWKINKIELLLRSMCDFHFQLVVNNIILFLNTLNHFIMPPFSRVDLFSIVDTISKNQIFNKKISRNPWD